MIKETTLKKLSSKKLESRLLLLPATSVPNKFTSSVTFYCLNPLKCFWRANCLQLFCFSMKFIRIKTLKMKTQLSKSTFSAYPFTSSKLLIVQLTTSFKNSFWILRNERMRTGFSLRCLKFSESSFEERHLKKRFMTLLKASHNTCTASKTLDLRSTWFSGSICKSRDMGSCRSWERE